MSTETLQLVALAAGTAGVAALVGALVLRALRTCTIGVQAAAVALVAVVSVGVGAWAGAQAMFYSDHDLEALVVMLLAAGAVGVGAALLLGRRVGRISRSLAEVARAIGDDARGDAGSRAPLAAPQELARLREELELTSTRLEEARARERALDASRRELVAWVSHDLRTPLAGIRAVIEALEDGVVDDPDTVARYHTTVREEADRLTALVDDLFELSRTQAGVLRLHLERVSLGDLVSDAIAGAAPIAEAKGVRLEGRLDGESPRLSVSAPEVLRALRNLLENAIRHTPSDGTVVVEAGLEAGHAYVSVVDSGGGIPEPDLPRVFEVAFRGDAARTPGTGAGLGLAIARGLVEAHRGEITVRNENGGACFTVRLPLVREPR
ncbi:MAG TPA: HAMP domain-containing sensor histidine kinase [Acidimicrobiia bacterium]